MQYYEDGIKKMLPKTYQRTDVAREIYAALTHFKNLVPKMDSYVYNDGTTKNLMSLSGTIPVMFQETSYNIPVCLWIEKTYPQTAPICYVKPTREMMVLSGTYVSSNGEVKLPYLDDWKKGECDLASLLQVMVVIFEDFPPVCMQPQLEPEDAPCWLQYHRQAEDLKKTDGSLCLRIVRDDDFQQDNETNC